MRRVNMTHVRVCRNGQADERAMSGGVCVCDVSLSLREERGKEKGSGSYLSADDIQAQTGLSCLFQDEDPKETALIIVLFVLARCRAESQSTRIVLLGSVIQ